MCRQGGKRRVGAARRRSRGHGPARLDGTRARATVADKVTKSGETAGHGNGLPLALTARQAKRAGPKLEAGPEASAEQREGTMEARQGRDAAGGSMRSTTARPAISQVAGDAQPSRFDEHQAHYAPHIGKRVLLWLRISGRSGAAGSAVFRGAKPRAAGIARRAFPWRQAQRAAPRKGREGIRPSRQGAGWIAQPASTALTNRGSSAYRAHTAPKARSGGRTR